MLSALVDGVVEAVAWILSFVLGELPDRPLWLRRLVALIYVLLFAALVVAAIVVLT